MREPAAARRILRIVVSDEELTALALAADPDTAVPDDAVPFRNAFGADAGLLPTWYMPAPLAGGGVIRGWRRLVLILLVLTFVIIEAYGLCSTYGPVSGA